jgi:hypothetical protein
MENGAKAGVRKAGVRRGRRGGGAGTGSVEVLGVGAGQIKAEELGSPLSRGAGVVGGAIPLAGPGAAKGFVGGRQETNESRGGSGMGNEGVGVGEVVAAGVGVEVWTRVMWWGTEEEVVRERAKMSLFLSPCCQTCIVIQYIHCAILL